MPLVTPLPDGPSRYPPSMPRSRTPSDASRHADEITRQKPSITADDLFPGGSRRPSLAGPSHHQYPQPSNYASGRGRQSPTPPSKYALSQDVVDHFETFDPDAAVRSRRSTGRSGSFAAQTQYRPPGTQALTTPPPPFGGNSPYDSQQRQLEGESAAYFARGPTAPGTGAPQQHHPQQMQQQQPPQVLQYQHSNQLAEHVEMQRQGMLHGGPHPKDISPQRCPDTAANQTPATSALGIEREALSARIDDIDSMLNGPPIECDRMNNLLLERQRHAARLAILTPEKDAFMDLHPAEIPRRTKVQQPRNPAMAYRDNKKIWDYYGVHNALGTTRSRWGRSKMADLEDLRRRSIHEEYVTTVETETQRGVQPAAMTGSLKGR